MHKVRNIPKEMSFVDLVFQLLTTCGKKAIVVKAPASNPMVVAIAFIIIFSGNRE